MSLCLRININLESIIESVHCPVLSPAHFKEAHCFKNQNQKLIPTISRANGTNNMFHTHAFGNKPSPLYELAGVAIGMMTDGRREDLPRHYSYFAGRGVVITWNSCLIYNQSISYIFVTTVE